MSPVLLCLGIFVLAIAAALLVESGNTWGADAKTLAWCSAGVATVGAGLVLLAASV